MPPPSLSMTTMRTGVETSRRAARPPMSWRRPRSPVTIVVGRPLACGGADPGGDEAVDAVGAAVAEEEDVGRRRRAGRPPGRGSACSRRCRRGRRRGGRAPSARCRPGSVRASRPSQLGLDRLARRTLGVEPGRSGARGSLAAEPRRPARRQLGRVGAQQRRRPAGRLVPAAERVDDDLVGAGVGEPGAQRLAGRHLAEAQDQVGVDAARELLVAQQEVVGGDDVGAVVRAAAQLRGRLGEDREAGGAGEVGERLAQLGVELAAGDDHSGAAPRRCARRPRRAGTRTARGRPASTAVSGRPSRPSSASGSVAVTAPSTGIGASGSRQGRLRWTGPGRGSPRAAASARQATER